MALNRALLVVIVWIASFLLLLASQYLNLEVYTMVASENSWKWVRTAKAATSATSVPSARVQTTAVTQATTIAKPVVQHGYLLELWASDQLTGGAMNIFSIQCLALKLSLRLSVVEPFIVNSSYGAVLSVQDRQSFDRENNVKLRDIYDIEAWHKTSDVYKYNRLATWESFINDAPREVVLVENQWWRDCDLRALTEKFSRFFSMFNFRVVRTVCLNFKKSGEIDAKQFKGVVYGNYVPEQVSVITDRLPGIGSVSPWETAVDVACSREQYRDLAINQIPSSGRIKHDAMEYIKRYFSGQRDYVSVMLRLEHFHMATTRSKVNEAVLHLNEAYKRWTDFEGSTSGTFLALDVGKYGSSEFYMGNRGPMEPILAEVRKFFYRIYNGSMTYTAWEESFKSVSGLKSGSGVSGYVAMLQKEIASQGRCLILIGGGSFQQSAGHLYDSVKREHACSFMDHSFHLL